MTDRLDTSSKADIIASVANDYYDSLKNEAPYINMKFEELGAVCRDFATQDVEQLLQEERREAAIDPFDFVEPCEPDCTPERHAYHQGQWDMAGRINESFGLLPHPGALTKEDSQQ